MFRAYFRLTLLMLLAVTVARADAGDAVVIVYAQFPGNAYEIGTGAFIDHDGLVLTADHVVHHIALSPPATSTSGSVPTPVVPTSITVYSAFLKAKLSVDLTQQGNLTSGALTATEWIDIALIRVNLTDTQKLQLQPLDLSPSAPARGESLNAYGPLCTISTDERCFQPAVTQTVLNNAPSSSRDYQVRDNITPGYSGGPLVNASGNIVGVASWGDVQNGTFATRASYVPSQYILRFFLGRAPIPSMLSAADACTRVQPLPSLTVFDWDQLSQRWVSQSNLLQSQEQCNCCCASLDKARNASIAPGAVGSCRPPFCAEQRFYGLANAIELAVATKTVDAGTAVQYQAFKATFRQIDLQQLPPERQRDLYTKFGSMAGELATNSEASKHSEFSDAGDTAIVALERSQQIKETQDNYYSMAKLFQAEGDAKNAIAASVLATVIDESPSTVHELKINPQALRKSIQASALAKQ